MGATFDENLNWDTQRLLNAIWDQWHDVFGITLGRVERTLVSELRVVRNRWAHEEPFSTDDAYRAIDSVERLLKAVSAPQREEARKQKDEMLLILSKEQTEDLGPTNTKVPSMNPTFLNVYGLLVRKGPGRATSSKGTVYRIEAKNGNIVAFPRRGRIVVHKDCWLQNDTCQGTRAGGIYNGPYSILHWYAENS